VIILLPALAKSKIIKENASMKAKKKNVRKLAIVGVLTATILVGLVACGGDDEVNQNLLEESSYSPAFTEYNYEPVAIEDESPTDEIDTGVPAWMLEMIPESSREAFSEAFKNSVGGGGATIFSPATGEVITGEEAMDIGREHGLIP